MSLLFNPFVSHGLALIAGGAVVWFYKAKIQAKVTTIETDLKK